MGKPCNVINFEEALARRQATAKPASKAMKQALDRINKRTDKIPKEKKISFSKNYDLVNEVLGCRTASALFSRLEYRFNIMPGGFYKFTAPCKNKSYRKGDSLCEEMRLHRDTVWRAAKKIVTAYKSKALYENAKASLGDIGAFQGKPYLSYLDKNTHQTFYLINRAVADLILEGKNPFKKKMFKRIKFSFYKPVFMALKVKNPTHGKSENPTHVSRKIRHIDAPEAAVYKASAPPTKNTYKEYSLSISLSEPEPLSEVITQEPIREREIKKVDLGEQPKMSNASEMVEIWKKHTGDMQGLSPKTVVLEECLEDQFNGSLDKWESYCKMIAKSKLLMGEKGKFKAYLGWAIKPENIEDVLSGDKYDQDRSNSIVDHKKIAEEEEREILSLDIPETIREIRLILLRGMGGVTYRAWMKDCLIDQIEGHGVYFNPATKFKTDWIKQYYVSHIMSAVGDMFQNVTIGGENLYVRK